MVAVALTVLVAIAGLANDIGYAWRARLSMQSAADAGAVAGAGALFMSGGVSAKAAAQAAASQNGFTDGSGTANNSNTVTVTVNNPPASGPNTGNNNAVEVIVAQAQPTYFLAVAGFTSMNVSARSVAAMQSSPNCMYALNQSASGALNLGSGGTISTTCGIAVDSNNSQALIGVSNSAISAPSLGIVGGKSWTGNPLPSNTTTGVAVVSDPLAYLPTPSPSGACTSLSAVGSNTTANIPAGFYCGLNASSNTTVNLTSSGTYSFDGSVSLSSNSALNGTSGVTLYFKSGSIVLSSNDALNLVAPTSGTYAGVVVFQDRADSTPLSLSSNVGMTLTGAVYAPDAALTISSNSFADVYSVASTINIGSGSAININADYSSLPGGSPIKMAVAVE